MEERDNYFDHFIIVQLVIFLTSFYVGAQDIPFNCDYNAYLFQHNDVYAIDLASGSSYNVATDITPGNINAAGYNAADGYIWGSLSTPSKTIVKIGKDFEVSTYYIDELPTNNRYIGDVDANGVYYLKPSGTTFYKIDLDPASPNYTQFISTGTLSSNITIHDWAFNAVDGQLYTVEKNTNHIYRVDPSNGNVTDLGEVPILSGLSYTYGAVYFDASGRFYVSANQTGTIYIVYDVQNLNSGDAISSNLFAYGPSSSSNDGARCPTAPVPQEDCINGIDDDGDGLVDCDDPSCSGVASCPVIQPPTTGGNEGGLESNRRLSQAINQRNYFRKKSNYRFDRSTARRIMPQENYASLSSTFTLADLIPLGVIDGATAIESSPQDLIAITNATELISVDYLKNEQPVAAILALKTENGVYEHTKYICDRLLGAELLSVSTITINEQQFIKSIIKNPDGSLEFVLSFSGRLVNGDSNFAVESHWNLDRYESGATFYNFQIWSNSLDDLLKLGEEVLSLMDTQRPVNSYNNSTPPPVFVKKGRYFNGTLELELVNANASETITFDAGLKRTETSVTDHMSASVNLEDDYISELNINTGSLFDIGFRISNGTDTPDDLFMSDGPWGLDDSASGTTVNTYTIEENDQIYSGNGYRVERNLNLKATTNDYVAAYRAFTPRFKPVDLSSYNTLEFDAQGTGKLEITLLKQSISDWEDQYRTTVTLTENVKHYYLPYDIFESSTNESLDLNDITTIVFTLRSEDNTTVTKEIDLTDIEFTANDNSLNQLFTDRSKVVSVPNPVITDTTIYFYADANQQTELIIYNQLGAKVVQLETNTQQGINSFNINRNKLPSGVYFYKINSKHQKYNSGKLLMN